MRLQLCDGVKKSWIDRQAALIFLTALVFLYRPVMAAGFLDWAGILFFSQGLFVLLATGFILLRWETLRSTLINSGWCSKICAGILLVLGFLHWLVGGYYRPEHLGVSLYWAILPVFGAVYRNDLERKLPTALGIFWLINVIVCIWTESVRAGMYGITGNWNWSAALQLVTFPFALRCIPLYCKGRKFYLALIWGISIVLLFYLQSRAVYLSIIIAGVFWVFLKYRKARLPLAAGAVLLIIAGWFAAFRVVPERTENFLKNEIRTEIWKGTVNLIKDVPVGIGVVTFENAYIPYRSIEYFKHRHAPDRDNHPHNEVLYIAATLGVAAAAAFVLWIVMALIGAVREYDAGTMSRKRVLFLLSFIVILCCSLLDLTLQVWPVGILGLIYFGMFAFPGKRAPQLAADGPANRIGKTVFVLTVFLALVNAVGTFCWDASTMAVARMDNVAAKKYAKIGLLLAPEIPNLLYRSAVEMSIIDRDFAMELAERMEQSPWKDYAHIHTLKAELYVTKGKYQEAVQEFLRDAECYPLQIRPCLGILMTYGRMGRQDLFPPVVQELDRRIKLRNLTIEQYRGIQMNPKYDLHPERVGEKVTPRSRWVLPFN